VSALRPPETFTTARLMLRPIALADAPDIFRYASDVETTRFMNFPRHRDMAEAEAFAQRCVQCWQNGSAFPWAVIARDSLVYALTRPVHGKSAAPPAGPTPPGC
jgi:RimJ/RimL family protein N-acetyltransferase